MAKGEVTFNIKSAEESLRKVRKVLTESTKELEPAFAGAAVKIVTDAVYGGPSSLAGMASDLAPVDTGALVAGLESPDSNESFDKGRTSQSVFSVSPMGKRGVQYVSVTYGTDPTDKDGKTYAEAAPGDFLSAPAAKFRGQMQSIGNEISRSIAAIIASNLKVATAKGGGYVPAKTKLSTWGVVRLIEKFGTAPIESASGRGYGYRKLASMSRSRYRRIMSQRRSRLK
jgi:hypothetical protein